jgi:hypothetical protein
MHKVAIEDPDHGVEEPWPIDRSPGVVESASASAWYIAKSEEPPPPLMLTNLA